jgi:hypothetical protein
MAEDMLLRKAEVQYVAEMPLDNRTVDKFAAAAATTTYGSRLDHLKCRPQRNDLMFRRDGQFCNIEPKICQYD